MFWNISRRDFLKSKLACLVSVNKAASESENDATNNRQRLLLFTKDLNITLANETTLQSKLCLLDFFE